MDLFQKLTRREAVKKVGTIPLFALLTPPGTGSQSAGGLSSGTLATGETPMTGQRTSLSQATIVVSPDEPSYVQHGIKDLADYLHESTAQSIPVKSTFDDQANVLIAVGQKMMDEILPGSWELKELADEGFRIRSIVKDGKVRVMVSGATPKGTNCGLATLMQLIRFEGNSAYLEDPLNIRSRPRFAVRGIHLNGWPLKNPYSFRTWQEKDWQRFVDLVWLQKGNLFFLWPFMEIMPVPLSPADEAYLQEVRFIRWR